MCGGGPTGAVPDEIHFSGEPEARQATPAAGAASACGPAPLAGEGASPATTRCMWRPAARCACACRRRRPAGPGSAHCDRKRTVRGEGEEGVTSASRNGRNLQLFFTCHMRPTGGRPPKNPSYRIGPGYLLFSLNLVFFSTVEELNLPIHGPMEDAGVLKLYEPQTVQTAWVV